MIADLDAELCRVVNAHVPVVSVLKMMGAEPWLDRECRTAHERKQLAYCQWARAGLVLIGWSSGWPNVVLMLVMVLQGFGFLRVVETSFNLFPLHMPGGSLERISLWRGFIHSPLQAVGDALVLDPALKAELLSEHFDGKQSRDSVALPLSCHPEPKFCSFAFKSREVERILLYLDVRDGVGPLFFSFVLC